MPVHLPILLIGERWLSNGQISVLRTSSSSSVPIGLWEQKVGDTTNEARTLARLGVAWLGLGQLILLGECCGVCGWG